MTDSQELELKAHTVRHVQHHPCRVGTNQKHATMFSHDLAENHPQYNPGHGSTWLGGWPEGHAGAKLSGVRRWPLLWGHPSKAKKRLGRMPGGFPKRHRPTSQGPGLADLPLPPIIGLYAKSNFSQVDTFFPRRHKSTF